MPGLVMVSLAPVSQEPPLVLWSVDRSSGSLDVWLEAPGFALHLLAGDQEPLAWQFARKGAEKFDGLDVTRGLVGAPILAGAAATIECVTHAQHDGGDHVILVGRVVAATVTERPPLVMHGGRMHGLPTDLDNEGDSVAKALLDGADLKLGLFSANCSSGMAVTKIEDRWQATWDDNLRLGRLADEVGLDFMLPIARWIGYGGETNFHEGVLDPVALAAGLLAETERIFVFATIHTAFNHPLVAAKQMATVDQIGRGRAGLQHRRRLEQAGVRRDGRRPAAGSRRPLRLRAGVVGDRQAALDGAGPLRPSRAGSGSSQGIESMPKPYDGLLPILNAGSSTQGRDFAARNSNVVFTVVGGPDDGAEVVATVEANARENYGREVGVFTPSYCVCRETKAEAEEFHRWYADENADWDAVDNLMTLQGLHAQSFSAEMLAMFRPRFAGGHGVCPLIGSPDDVAAEIKRFHDAGFGGMTLSFVDYVGELEYFAQEVLPRLEALGVRNPR